MAQELNLPINNQYISDNPYLISAAYAGIGDCWQARATGLQQWVGVENAPSTQSLSFDGRIQDRSGIGLVLYNDSNGYTSQKGIKASFAHHVTLSKYNKQYLSFGLSYKYTQFLIDASSFNRLTDIDGNIVTNNHNVDVSALYRLGSFFVSLNAVNLIFKQIDDFSIDEPLSITSYFVYSGFKIKKRYSDVEYEPSILYRTFASDSRTTLDINFKVRKYAKKANYFWLGGSVRSLVEQDFTPVTFSPMIGMDIFKFYFAYAYQVNLNESVQLTSGGTHLLTLGIDFGCQRSNCGCTN